MVSSFLEEEGILPGLKTTSLEMWRRILMQNLTKVLACYRSQLLKSERALGGVDAKLRLPVRMLLAAVCPNVSEEGGMSQRGVRGIPATGMTAAAAMSDTEASPAPTDLLAAAAMSDTEASPAPTDLLAAAAMSDTEASPAPTDLLAAAVNTPGIATSTDAKTAAASFTCYERNASADLNDIAAFASQSVLEAKAEGLCAVPPALEAPAGTPLHKIKDCDKRSTELSDSWKNSVVGRCFGASGSHPFAHKCSQVWVSPDRGETHLVGLVFLVMWRQ
jgi:hypothetical protein